MIYATLNTIQEYCLDENLNMCIEYAKEHDLLNYELGTYDINENIFVNIISYETKKREERFFEAHRKYLDIHLILEGQEIIDVNDIDNMVQKEYQEDQDFLPIFGDSKCAILMKENDVLVCYPHDGHQTAVKVEESMIIKKAIFKVKI